MSAQDNSGPAFPHPDYLAAGWAGMTLRDYFAAKALPLVWDVVDDNEPMLDIASSAYRMADAMLKARQSWSIK